MKKVVILQSNYIPWKGYFDLIASVDEFIIYDEVQYTKNDWRNRNLIKTPQGLKWLTIPVGADSNRAIKDVVFSNRNWGQLHCQALHANYRREKYFDEVFGLIEPILMDVNIKTLTEVNVLLIKVICSYLKVNTKISYSWDYGLIEGKTERLVDLSQKTKASTYVSGPSAKNYIDQKNFQDAGIELQWFNYSDYKEYPQLWRDFEHAVSILDLLFNCGQNSSNYMRFINDSF